MPGGDDGTVPHRRVGQPSAFKVRVAGIDSGWNSERFEEAEQRTQVLFDDKGMACPAPSCRERDRDVSQGVDGVSRTHL